MLIPTRRRTWGRKGERPVVRYNYRHDRISALAALSVSASQKRMGLYLRFQQENFKATHVAYFLRHFLRHVPGPIVLVWDSAQIHGGPHIRAVCDQFPRLHLEPFPKYAPELNPTEQIWQDWKGRTANSLYQNKTHLRNRLHCNARRVRSSQERLRSFVRASDLPSPFTW